MNGPRLEVVAVETSRTTEERMAALLHAPCEQEWQRLSTVDPGRLLTLHDAASHMEQAVQLVAHAPNFGLKVELDASALPEQGWFGYHRCGGEARVITYSTDTTAGTVWAMCTACGQQMEQRIHASVPAGRPD